MVYILTGTSSDRRDRRLPTTDQQLFNDMLGKRGVRPRPSPTGRRRSNDLGEIVKAISSTVDAGRARAPRFPSSSPILVPKLSRNPAAFWFPSSSLGTYLPNRLPRAPWEVKTVAATGPRCLQFLFRVGPIGGRESLFSARHDAAPVKRKTSDAVLRPVPSGRGGETSRAWRGENLSRHQPLLFSVPPKDNRGTKTAKPE